MKEYLDRILNSKGDPTQQVMDLMVFVGYFSVCLYAGGMAYQTSYNDYYSLISTINIKDSYLAVLFATKVLSSGWYWSATSVYVLFFIYLYYSCRYAWRPWFGYFILSLLLYSTFLACSALGECQGRRDATSDGLKDTSSLPVVKLYTAAGSGGRYADGNYHLLNIDKEYFYIFEPAGVDGSVLQIQVIQRKKINNYEVTVK